MHSVGEQPIAALQHGIEKAVKEAKAPSRYPEFDDPTFIAGVRAFHEAEEKKYYLWLATADFEALIDNAIQVGRAAYAVAPDDTSDADRLPRPSFGSPGRTARTRETGLPDHGRLGPSRSSVAGTPAHRAGGVGQGPRPAQQVGVAHVGASWASGAPRAKA